MFFRWILPIAFIIAMPFIMLGVWNGGDYRMLLTIFLGVECFKCLWDLLLASRGQERQTIVVDVVETE